MKYRSDIDGLRAVAVVSVILSHAGFSAFSGGFVGVDVFFVISGFLITTILRSDMANGSYSLGRFYERRARRILPALLLVIVVTFPFACVLLLPNFLKNFGQSVVATLLFSNNLLLAKTSGYWELESNFKPLLHTWSLGVEEQFYIVFPVLLGLVWGFGRRWQLAMIAVLGMASFALAEYGWRAAPTFNFYMPTARAWELMIGGACAYVPRQPRRLDHVLSFVGLVAIVASVLLYTERTPSPSYYILLPVLGSASVLVFTRPGGVTSRILSLRPLVGIGLISYSAYLWHQPLFAMTRVAMLSAPGPWIMGGLCLLSIGLAWLSWKYVEQPFRTARLMPLWRFAPSVVLASVALIASGLYLHVSGGFPQRVFPNVTENGDVSINYNERVRKYSRPTFPQNGERNVLVIGNSFGRDVANLLIECGCLKRSNLVYYSSGAEHFSNTKAPADAPALLGQADIVVVAIQVGDASQLIEGIRRIQSLATRGSVIVFGPKQFGNNLNPFLRVAMADRPGTLSTVAPSVTALNEALRQSVKDARFVDLLQIFGKGDGQAVFVFDEKGNLLSFDRIHLTKFGAIFAAEKLREQRPDVVAQLQAGG